jgi:hypothetical protein
MGSRLCQLVAWPPRIGLRARHFGRGWAVVEDVSLIESDGIGDFCVGLLRLSQLCRLGHVVG